MSSKLTSFLKPAAYGATLWAGAALFANRADTWLFARDTPIGRTIALYAISIPVVFASVRILPVLRICAKHDIMRATLIGGGTALTLDGLAFTFAPGLYGTTTDSVRAPAWIMFGAGFTLFSALL